MRNRVNNTFALLFVKKTKHCNSLVKKKQLKFLYSCAFRFLLCYASYHIFGKWVVIAVKTSVFWCLTENKCIGKSRTTERHTCARTRKQYKHTHARPNVYTSSPFFHFAPSQRSHTLTSGSQEERRTKRQSAIRLEQRSVRTLHNNCWHFDKIKKKKTNRLFHIDEKIFFDLQCFVFFSLSFNFNQMRNVCRFVL